MTGALKFLPVAMLALVACKKTEDVPSYLEVPVFGMTTDPSQGAPSTKITDAWVTVNGTFVGVWELPARIPVLGAGQAEVEVAPAIKRKPGDTVVAAFPAPDGAEVIAVASNAQAMRCEASTVPLQGRGAGGVTGMKLGDGATVVGATVVGAAVVGATVVVE